MRQMMQPMFRPQQAFMPPQQLGLGQLQPLVSTSQPIGSLSGAGGQFGQVAGNQPGQAHKSLDQVLAEKGFQLPQKPTGPVTQDMVMFGPDPVTGRSRGGGSSESGYYKAVDDFYAQNPEALEIAKQFDADPGSFGGVPNVLAGQLGTSIVQPAQAQPAQGQIEQAKAQPARLSQQGMDQMQQMQAMMREIIQMISALSNRGGYGGGFGGGYGGGFGGYQPQRQQMMFGGIGSIPMSRGLFY